MKYCKKCNVSVDTVSEKCPLCFTMLASDGGPVSGGKYPVLEGLPQRSYNFVFRLLLLISIVAGSTSVLINILTYAGSLWSLIVAGGILFLWITVAYPLFIKRNIGHIIITEVLSVSAFLYIIEAVTHSQGWGLNYIIPFLFTAATLMITFILLLKRMKWREYSVYQMIMMALGLLPVVFLIAGLVTVLWPSLLSAFYSIMTFTGMMIFADKKYKSEIHKRFHL